MGSSVFDSTCIPKDLQHEVAMMAYIHRRNQKHGAPRSLFRLRVLGKRTSLHLHPGSAFSRSSFFNIPDQLHNSNGVWCWTTAMSFLSLPMPFRFLGFAFRKQEKK
jgi:hypothetical protein